MAPSFAPLGPLGPLGPHPLPRLLLLPLLLLLLAVPPPATPAPIRYDQRQTGNLNVQVDLKDVEIYAILDESLLAGLGGGDYDYDYSQLTEKPLPTKPGSSSTSPSSTATASSTTTTTTGRPSTPSAGLRRAGTSVKEIPILLERSADRHDGVESHKRSPADDVPVDAPSTPSLPPTASPAATSPRPTTMKISVAHRRCGAGFHRDAAGRCRRDRRPLRKYALKRGRRPASSRSSGAAAGAGQPTPVVAAADAPVVFVLRESVEVTSAPAVLSTALVSLPDSKNSPAPVSLSLPAEAASNVKTTNTTTTTTTTAAAAAASSASHHVEVQKAAA